MVLSRTRKIRPLSPSFGLLSGVTYFLTKSKSNVTWREGFLEISRNPGRNQLTSSFFFLVELGVLDEACHL